MLRGEGGKKDGDLKRVLRTELLVFKGVRSNRFINLLHKKRVKVA